MWNVRFVVGRSIVLWLWLIISSHLYVKLCKSDKKCLDILICLSELGLVFWVLCFVMTHLPIAFNFDSLVHSNELLGLHDQISALLLPLANLIVIRNLIFIEFFMSNSYLILKVVFHSCQATLSFFFIWNFFSKLLIICMQVKVFLISSLKSTFNLSHLNFKISMLQLVMFKFCHELLVICLNVIIFSL